MSTTERTREIGLLRAIGLARRQVTSVLRIESVLIAGVDVPARNHQAERTEYGPPLERRLALGWRLARPRRSSRGVVGAVAHVVSGVVTGFGLFAITGVLTTLLTAGPTPERVVAAVPALLESLRSAASCALVRSPCPLGSAAPQAYRIPGRGT